MVHLEDSNFASLIHLTYLDISHNDALVFENRGRMFLGLEQSLQHLKLKNVSLTFVSILVRILHNIILHTIMRNTFFYFSDTGIITTISIKLRCIEKSNINYITR